MSTQDNQDKQTEESLSSNIMPENDTDNIILDAEKEENEVKTNIESEAITLDPVDTESQITKMEKEIADLKDKLLRFMAEAENVRKRSERHYLVLYRLCLKINVVVKGYCRLCLVG